MTSSECSCEKCQSFCKNQPGWFMPGEAEKVAAYLGMPLPNLLGWQIKKVRSPRGVEILQPATIGGPAEGLQRGVCTFFSDGRCRIHAVKPFECRNVSHADMDSHQIRQDIYDAWKAVQVA